MKDSPARLTTYTIGFVLSIGLTIAAYVLVANNVLSGSVLIASILGLAVIQLFVQLVFFLHLGRESKPRWNLMAFLFMLLVLLIVVFGSLWIMSHLNYHGMSPHETDKYLLEEEALREKPRQ